MTAKTSSMWLLRVLTLGTTVGIAVWLIVDTQQFANSTVRPSEHAVPATESGLSDAPFFGPSTKSTIGIGNGVGGAFPGRGGGRDLKGK